MYDGKIKEEGNGFVILCDVCMAMKDAPTKLSAKKRAVSNPSASSSASAKKRAASKFATSTKKRTASTSSSSSSKTPGNANVEKPKGIEGHVESK